MGSLWCSDIAEINFAHAVTWVGCSPLFICFPDDILKTDAARITKLFIRNVSRWVLQAHLFWNQKVSGQGHNVYVGLQTEERNIAAAGACVSYAGFYLL